MAFEARTNWKYLAPWLLACPVLLIAGVLILPQYSFLYATRVESAVVLISFALPFVGLVGIVRLLRSTRGVVVAASIAYLAITLPLAMFSAIFIGCSWARACF